MSIAKLAPVCPLHSDVNDIAATFMTGYWGMNIEIERFTSMPYDDFGFWYVGKCESDPE